MYISIYVFVCVYIYLFIYLFIYICVYPLIWLFIIYSPICAYLFIYLSVVIYIYASIYWFLYLLIYFFVYVSVYLFIYSFIKFCLFISFLFMHLFICLCAYLFIDSSICFHEFIHLSIYRCIDLSIYHPDQCFVAGSGAWQYSTGRTSTSRDSQLVIERLKRPWTVIAPTTNSASKSTISPLLRKLQDQSSICLCGIRRPTKADETAHGHFLAEWTGAFAREPFFCRLNPELVSRVQVSPYLIYFFKYYVFIYTSWHYLNNIYTCLYICTHLFVFFIVFLFV